MPDVMKNRDHDVVCEKDIWTLVAKDITDGFIGNYGKETIKCLVTYRLSGSPAPTDKNEGIMFSLHNIFRREPQMHFSEPVDVYVMPLGKSKIIYIERDPDSWINNLNKIRKEIQEESNMTKWLKKQIKKYKKAKKEKNKVW